MFTGPTGVVHHESFDNVVCGSRRCQPHAAHGNDHNNSHNRASARDCRAKMQCATCCARAPWRHAVRAAAQATGRASGGGGADVTSWASAGGAWPTATRTSVLKATGAASWRTRPAGPARAFHTAHTGAASPCADVGSGSGEVRQWQGRVAGAMWPSSSSPDQRMGGVRRLHRVDVVLLDELDNLGFKGEEVSVKAGYARNYLVPRSLAVYATDATRALYKEEVDAETAAQRGRERELRWLKTRVSQVALKFARASQDGEHLYGSVSAGDIVTAIADAGLKLSLSEADIRFESTNRKLDTIGDHTVSVQVAPGEWADVVCTVTASS